MFTLSEAASWSEDETLMRVIGALPVGWSCRESAANNTFYASVTDAAGVQVWGGEQHDRKLLFLDCLGWLSIKDHKTKNPMWRVRDTEVPLYRPSIAPSPVPDPPDLDPTEVAAVYRGS